MVQIREFDFSQDFEAVRNLWKEVGAGIQLRRSDDPEEILKKLQRDPDLFLVATSGEKIVGSVIGGFDGRRGLIYHLAVDEDSREQGIGSQLMDEVENRLCLKGCIKSYLLVTKENKSAMHFYEMRGWQQMDSLILYGKEF